MAESSVVRNMLHGRPPSIRRVAANGWASFDDLPAEVIANVISYLPAVDVGRIQRVSTRTRSAASAPDVWSMLLQRDFQAAAEKPALGGRGSSRLQENVMASIRGLMAGAASGGSSSGTSKAGAATTKAGGIIADARDRYKRRFDEHRRQIRAQQADRERRVQEMAAEGKARQLRVCLDMCEFPLGLGAPCVCIAVFFLLLMLKLGGVVDMSYSHVWAAWWAGIGIVIASAAVGLVVRRCARRASLTSMWRNQDDGSEYGIGWMVAEGINDHLGDFGCAIGLRFLWFASFLLCGFVLFPLFVQLKLEGVTAFATAPWAAVFAPVWGVFLLWCCFSCAVRKCFSDSDKSLVLHIFSCMLLWVPLLIVAILVVVRLDGLRYIEMTLIYIPFWVFDGILLVATIVLFLIACLDDDEDDRALELKLGFSFLTVLLFALPFQIVSSVYDHSNKTFPAVWTMISLVAAVGCVAIVGCMMMRYLWKRSRDRQFGDAYEWRSRRMIAANILPGARSRLLPR